MLARVDWLDRRKNTESVASEVNDVFRLIRRHAGDHGVVDVLDRVGATSVLSDTGILVVGFTSRRVVGNVFENRTETDGIVDIGFLLSIETDTLGVAEYEGTVISQENRRNKLNFRKTHHPPSMLKTPLSDQTCSSSPMRERRGSAERVVFPVPERPKKRETSPSGPWFAEE